MKLLKKILKITGIGVLIIISIVIIFWISVYKAAYLSSCDNKVSSFFADTKFQIDYFEEYPEIDSNLQKAKLIDYPATVYFASYNYDSFLVYKNKLKNINPKLQTAWWPLIEHSYWISPFVNQSDLKKLLNYLRQIGQEGKNGDTLTVLFDLELPLDWKMYLANFAHFKSNRHIIEDFIKNPPSGINIITAEHAATKMMSESRLISLGISYPEVTKKRIIMYYSSMRAEKDREKNKLYLLREKNCFGNDTLQVGLGTIATGIYRNEPVMSTEMLEGDLKFLKINGFTNATIFRLGGLNKEYIEIIKKYQQ